MKEGAHPPPRILTRPQRQRLPTAPPSSKGRTRLDADGVCDAAAVLDVGVVKLPRAVACTDEGQQQQEQEEGLAGASQ